MTNEEKRNIYNAIQNLYNMDFTSWQEVLAMMYNLVADTSQKFEVFEQKFDIMLGSEVTKAIKELYENGKLTEIINSEVFKNLNSKIDYLQDNNEKTRKEISEQLDNIANKGTTVAVLERVTKQEIDRQIADGTMANLTIAPGSITQDKLSPDIDFGVKDGEVTPEKTTFIEAILGSGSSEGETDVKFEYNYSGDILATNTGTNQLYCYKDQTNTNAQSIILNLQKGLVYRFIGKNLTRCRIGVVYNKKSNELVFNRPGVGTIVDEVIKNDDTLKEMDITYIPSADSCIILYIANNGGATVNVKVQGAPISGYVLSDDIKISNGNIDDKFIGKEKVREDFFNDYFISKTTQYDTVGSYPIWKGGEVLDDSTNLILTYSYVIEGLTEETRFKVSNNNRFRIVGFNKPFAELNITNNQLTTVVGVIVEYDDMFTGEFTLDSTYKTYILQLAYNVDSKPTLTTNSIELRENIKVQGIKTDMSDITVNLGINKLNNLYAFPLAPNDWIATGGDRVLEMSSDEFLELFYDKHLGCYPDGLKITKRSLGKDTSGIYDIYEYDFKPKSPSQTLLLSSGMHTYELSASFGLAHFMQEYMKGADDNFKFLRQNVRIKLIAIVNPWGWNQNPKTYGNCNGVNINRNFDYNDMWSNFPTYKPSENEWNVKGSKSFSEKETQILRDWLIENNHAKLWIDCHTGYNDVRYHNWIYYCSKTPVLKEIKHGLNLLSARIKDKYGVNSINHEEIDNIGNIKADYSEKVIGIPCLIIEQSPKNATWGTPSYNNDGVDITEYATYIYAYVFSILKQNTSAIEWVKGLFNCIN